MKKVIFLLLAVLMISTVFVGCDTNLASKAKHITLDPDIINMKVGETIEVKAKMTDGKGKSVSVDNSKFEWSIVTGEDAISIVPNGNTVKITAKKTLIGNAMIKISHPDALTYIQRVVRITKGENSGGNTGNTDPSSNHISLNPDEINVKVGETIEVTAKITDGNNQTVTVDNSKFEWSIASGEDAISIVPNGDIVQIKAKKVVFGGAIIRVTHPDAEYRIERVVHITKGYGDICIEPDIINIKVGETIEVTVEIKDEYGQIVTVDNSKFEWSIFEGAEVIDIAPNGNKAKITAKQAGQAIIDVYHPDRGNDMNVVNVLE